MRLRFALAAAAMLSASLAAHADSVTYTFTLPSGMGVYSGVASFTEPSIQTTAFDVLGADISSTTSVAITEIFINPTGSTCGGETVSGDNCYTFDFADGSYGYASLTAQPLSLGDYTTTAGYADITLDITSDVAPTPEPSGIALLGTGLLGVAGMVRRRFA